ncbi:Ribonuclease P protein component 3 [Palaeococcus sp. (in: euryarchaeotes)]
MIELDVRNDEAYALAEQWYDEVVFTKVVSLEKSPDYAALNEELSELRAKYKHVALLLITKKPSLIRELKNRKLRALLYVQGGNLKINRAALEAKVDALISPELGRRDSGMDHILARMAARNDVAIGFSFSPLLRANPYERANMLRLMMRNWRLIEKYRAPRFLTSSAESIWEVRAPRDLMSFGIALGMEIPQAKASLTFFPQKILKKIKN